MPTRPDFAEVTVGVLEIIGVCVTGRAFDPAAGGGETYQRAGLVEPGTDGGYSAQSGSSQMTVWSAGSASIPG